MHFSLKYRVNVCRCTQISVLAISLCLCNIWFFFLWIFIAFLISLTSLRPNLSHFPPEKYATFHLNMPEFYHVQLKESTATHLSSFNLLHSERSENLAWQFKKLMEVFRPWINALLHTTFHGICRCAFNRRQKFGW